MNREQFTCGSSQANESFNALVARLVAKKYPKSRYYGGSSSDDARVDAALLKKNEGTSYIVDLNKKCTGALCKSSEFKSRRKQFKKNRFGQKSSIERKEDITSNCALSRNSLSVDKPSINDAIPKNLRYVFFDLETTGFSQIHAEIIQIGATYKNRDFNGYILPTRGIPRQIEEITGLEIENDRMFKQGDPVITNDLHQTLIEFLKFLVSVGHNIILVAHNGFALDARLLLRDIKKTGLWDIFVEIVYGIADSIPILKKKMPERVKARLSFKQTSLASHFFGGYDIGDAHDALHDASVLQDLVSAANVSREELREGVKSIAKLVNESERSAQKMKCKATMDELKGFISLHMINKIATVGLGMHDLQIAYTESGEPGLRNLLQEDVQGRPRVTKSNAIILKVIQGIKKSLDNK